MVTQKQFGVVTLSSEQRDESRNGAKKEKKRERETKWGIKECERWFFQTATSHVQIEKSKFSRIAFVTLTTNYENFEINKKTNKNEM